MRRTRLTELGSSVVHFFEAYLPTQRGMSQHTIRSYRDAIVMLLRFVATQRDQPIEELDLAHLRGAVVTAFLAHLEAERGNGVATRNVRLAAIHTLARFLAGRYPDQLGTWQAILAIPFKRGKQHRPPEHLTADGVRAILESIDRTSINGERDFVLFALMFNTGARVQEILDLRPSDVRLEPPEQIRLLGKGNKVRVCPIWPHTAQLIQRLLKGRPPPEDGDAVKPLFLNQRGQPLSRFGVRYLLRKYALRSGALTVHSHGLPHPHSLRHTTAVHLLKAGVDFATISQWLGHASLNTTMRYARSDLDSKRQAMAQVFPKILSPASPMHVSSNPQGLTTWLRRL